jgi:hypothetical protein
MTEGINRRVKLLVLAFICFLFLAALCSYVFIMVRYKHAWAVILIMASFVLGFFIMGVCFGFNSSGPGFHVETRDMSEESYLNRRDVGFFFAGSLWFMTYIIPFVIWNHSSGNSLPFEGVCVAYLGNTFVATGFLATFRVFFYG